MVTSDTNNREGGEALDVDGVASLLRCSATHVRALVRNGTFPAPAKLGTLARWSRAVVLRWLDENTGATVKRGGREIQVRG